MTDERETTVLNFYKRRMIQQPFTENELAWIEFIRLASQDSDPGITLARVQVLRKMFDDPPACD